MKVTREFPIYPILRTESVWQPNLIKIKIITIITQFDISGSENHEQKEIHPPSQCSNSTNMHVVGAKV